MGWGEQIFSDEIGNGLWNTNQTETAITSIEKELQDLLEPINRRAGKDAIHVGSSRVSNKEGKGAHIFWCSLPRPMIDNPLSGGKGLFRGILTAIEAGSYKLEPLPPEYGQSLIENYDPSLRYFWIYKI